MITLDITKTQLKKFLKYLNDETLGICEACGDYHRLMVHHWHDQDDITKYLSGGKKVTFPSYERKVCGYCNQWLTRNNIEKFAVGHGYQFINEFNDNGKMITRKTYPNWLWSHVLPPWEIQLEFVHLNLQRSKTIGHDEPAIFWLKYRKSSDNARRVFLELDRCYKGGGK